MRQLFLIISEYQLRSVIYSEQTSIDKFTLNNSFLFELNSCQILQKPAVLELLHIRILINSHDLLIDKTDLCTCSKFVPEFQ